jgi:hypothetical protein
MTADCLSHAEALTFIETCRRSNTHILGIERFVRVGGQRRPDLDGIADFSSAFESGQGGSSIESAQGFIASYGRDSNECFELVLSD